VNHNGTLLLTRDDLNQLLDLDDYLEVVEAAFRAYALGRSLPPALMHVEADGGEFHIKAGGLRLDRPYFALKANGGFFNNARFEMPPIQGVILLCDAESGYPLAVMDSTAITLARTGATTVLAARHLARRDASAITICGCGNQGTIQLRYLASCFPGIRRAYAWDLHPRNAESFAETMSGELGIDVQTATSLDDALAASDICVTCTPARAPFIHEEHLHPGLFIAAIGADSPDKQEIDAAVLKSATVVVDLVEQCAQVGELHHALAAGVLRGIDVHGELSDIITGRIAGRTSPDEVFVFDATGTALQDTAAAAAAFAKAVATRAGSVFDFFSRAVPCN
jgi:ornithine cyclodeaminase/alanine dehydrogenase